MTDLNADQRIPFGLACAIDVIAAAGTRNNAAQSSKIGSHFNVNAKVWFRSAPALESSPNSTSGSAPEQDLQNQLEASIHTYEISPCPTLPTSFNPNNSPTEIQRVDDILARTLEIRRSEGGSALWSMKGLPCRLHLVHGSLEVRGILIVRARAVQTVEMREEEWI